MKYTLYTDGGSRGNPGPAGAAAILWKDHTLIGRWSKFLGKATNNQAEYEAIILGLQKAKDLGPKEIECFLDSNLIVNQLNRSYKIKDKDLIPLFVKVWNLSLSFKKVSFHYLPREKNKEADKLVNAIIDKHTSIC